MEEWEGELKKRESSAASSNLVDSTTCLLKNDYNIQISNYLESATLNAMCDDAQTYLLVIYPNSLYFYLVFHFREQLVSYRQPNFSLKHQRSCISLNFANKW